MKDYKRVFFKDLTEKRKSFGKLILVPASLILHSAVVLSLIIYPMVSAGEMPEIKSLSVKLLSMPKLITPGVRSGGVKGRRGGDTRPSPHERKNADRMVPPLEIPSEIEEPDIFADNSDGPGVDGGIDQNFLDSWGDPFGTGDGDRDLISATISMVRSPRLIKKIVPVYPQLALKVRREANIILEAVTDIYGKVKKVRIVSGDFLLNEAAVNAIKQWIYEPYIINGIPQPVKFTVTISFRLKR